MKKSISIICILFILISILNTHSTLAAVYDVDNVTDIDNLATYTNNDGTNTLRKCIRLANLGISKDTIQFKLIGAAPFTILLNSNLPPITSPLYLNGFSQTGVVFPTPGIVVKGSGISSSLSTINNTFFINNGASSSVIRGIIMYRTQNMSIYVDGASNCTIEGCWIGITENGIMPTPLTNRVGEHGIYLGNGANNCIIGSSTARNVISGNRGHGIVSVNNTGLTIVNNYIGTNITATDSIPNGIHGINVENTSQVVIGGGAANLGNVISGNKGQGITIFSNSDMFDIKGNKIGTNGLGTLAIANGVHGINVELSAQGQIGGTGLFDGNLISGNKATGLTLTNASNNCVIKRNKIGTNLAGIAAIPNGSHGISIYDRVNGTIIGGEINKEGNLISGNGYYGINNVLNSRLTKIYGNLVGTTANGMGALPNMNHGIYFESSNKSSIGLNISFRNIISGNSTNGLSFLNCDSVSITGNFIGASISGKVAIPNATGLSITNGKYFTIGSDSAMLGNVISGNTTFGLYANNLDNSYVKCNKVGVDSLGNTALANGVHGIETEGGCDLVDWINNIVSGNGQNGFDLLLITNNNIYGNKIGLGVNGTTKIANGIQGIRINGGSNNKIGSANKLHRNYISGNGNHAILFDNACNNNSVKGNYVGSDTSGTVAIGNNNSGIILLDNSTGNQIGGVNAGEGNLFCCSLAEDGIRVQVSPSTLIYNNLIGTNKNGVLATGFGNAFNGIWIMAYGPNSNNCEVGGLATGKANTIANNGGDGVKVSGYGNPSNFIPIIGNKINCNGGAGINFEANNAFENEGILAPVVTSSSANTINGTGGVGNTVHVYRNNYSDGTRCDCEGEIYVGTTTVSGSGTWTYTHNLNLTTAQRLSVTATQTNSNKSTSEFWVCTAPLPVAYLYIRAIAVNNQVTVQWSTSNEINSSHFIIEKSFNGKEFYAIATIPAINEGKRVTTYEYIDEQVQASTAYYRIVQIDLDNQYNTSKIVSVSSMDTQIDVFPNPSKGILNIRTLQELPLQVVIYDMVGKTLLELDNIYNAGSIDLTNFAKGMYHVHITQGDTQKDEKIIIE